MQDEIVVERIQSQNAFFSLRQKWTLLLEKSDNKNIFLTWEWQYAWWAVYGEEKDLWLLTVKENGELIGIAPLMIRTSKKFFIKLRILMSIGTPQADIGGFITSKNEVAIPAITTFINDAHAEWDILELNNLQENVTTNVLLPNFFQQKHYRIIKTYRKHLYLPLEQNWENYFNSLSKNMRRNLRKQRRRAEEKGAIDYKIFKGKNLQWENFLTIFEINKKGRYPEIYQLRQSRDFLRQLYDIMQEKEWLQIEMLFFNQEAIAFQCGYHYDQKYLDWRGGYNRNYQKMSAGKLLMMLSIEQRIQDRVLEIDFLRGEHSYKSDWRPLSQFFFSMRVFQIAKPKSLLAYFWLAFLKPRMRKQNKRKIK